MAPVLNRCDLEAARSLSQALIFFWVNWSIHAIHSRIIVEQAELLQQTLPMSVPYFVIDVSDQSGELWEALREWLQVDDTATEQAIWGGSGSLLWIRSGKVVHQMIDPMNHTAANIAAISRRTFSSAL
jgi:hypothetical protein